MDPILEFRACFSTQLEALMAVLLLWMLAFNLLQLFVYRRLGVAAGRRIPPIRHIVEVMLRDVATLPAPIPWATFLLDTSVGAALNGRRGRTDAITVHLPAALPSRRFTLDN